MLDQPSIRGKIRMGHSKGSAFRFLWRDLESTIPPPSIYQTDVHIFGAASSPAVRLNALRQAAKDAGNENMLKQITRYFYVDNWLLSFPTTTEAISTTHQLTETLKKCGVPLTQWATSNKTAVRQRPNANNDTKEKQTDCWTMRSIRLAHSSYVVSKVCIKPK